MNGRRPRFIAAALAALCVLIVLGWAAAELLRDPLADLGEPAPAREPLSSGIAAATTADRESAPVPPGRAYVGSAACADCHADIADTYVSHPMSRSAALPGANPAGSSSDGSVQFTVPGPTTEMTFEYRVTTDESGMTHREAALNAAGEEICSRTVPVHYAIGSGTRGRSYFIDLGGQLYMSPLTWYAGARDWDLSPGYEKANEHFERRILDDCVFCHVGRAAPKRDRRHTFEKRPIVEMGIGCERCHGPGEAHVSYHQASGDGRPATDPIVNPARLSQPLRDDVCFQCHLQGIGRVAHPGRRSFDFRPGQAFAEFWTVLMHGTKVSDDNTTRAVGQAEQMLASRCYIESQGAMSCTSCHDPHAKPTVEERTEFYRSKCLECHGTGDGDECTLERSARLLESSEDSCIQCHMPRLAANDVPHTSQTDHRVIRRPVETAGPQGRDEISVYELDHIPLELVNRSRGVLLVHQSEELRHPPLAEQAIPLLAPWVSSHSQDAEALAVLGTAYYFSQDTRNALAMLDLSLAIDPNSEYALRQRMNFSHEIGDLEGGIRYGRRLIAINPHHYDYHGRMAHMLGQAGEWSEAIDSALQAVEIRPWSPQIHGWLAEAYRITGQQDLSLQHAEIYKQLQPAGPTVEP